VGRQAWPALAVEQSTHAEPDTPQELASEPVAQRPFSQQPPAHGDSAEHWVEQVWLIGSQALLPGQSLALMQPQLP
jgi:hypothetical protein